ncbi:NAD(P)-dependent oxidoreductase [Nocardia nova]|uniref:NAD(P)-dependent oxidoreductase n=1 Tax=Nocardia nova TaxID=37330 RepID=UPI00046CCC24|nr:NAD(P)-dependent oxidoreductase [Nocardia nova]
MTDRDEVTVLVPHTSGMAALSRVDRVRPLRYDPASLPPGAERARILIPDYRPDPRAVALASRLPELQLVQLLTSGADRWLGRLPAGVLLSTARGAHGEGVAEWVLGALIALCRDFPALARARQEHRWATHDTGTLYGQRVLIVGAGDLARALTDALAPFRAPVTLVARTARPGVHAVDELAALLPRHDIVVLAVPLTERTRMLMDAPMLAGMNDGAILVNVSRGPVVDTDALTAELYSHRLRAALDVTDPEPLPPHHRLWGAPGLFLTPHTAGTSSHSTARAYAVAAAQIRQFLDGRAPENLII